MKLQSLNSCRVICIILVMLLILPGFYVQHVQAKTVPKSQADTVIRVGYPIQKGLSMRGADGELSGYTYDYLMEISQYTGWTYDFVMVEGSLNEQLLTMMEMLKTGEIDLLGAMLYNGALTADYTYSGYCYGVNYSGLFVPEDSALRETSLYNLNELRVGVYHRNRTENAKLEQFAQMSNLTIEQVLTDTADDFYSMTKDGRAEAILSTDLAMADLDHMIPIVHFSPAPFYFATTKGNTGLIEQLDFAIRTIDTVNPDFGVQLYDFYFSKTSGSLFLTENEKEFIQDSQPLDVVMYQNKPPFQYLDTKTQLPTGITTEILEDISRASGLTFRYHTVSTYEEYLDFLRSGKADIAADVLSNYQDALDTNTSLTLPWSNLPLVRYQRKGTAFQENGKAAIPYFLKNIIEIPEAEILYFDTVKECLDAVKSQAADYCYVGDFSGQYFNNAAEYEELQKVHQADIQPQKLCFGVYSNGDYRLLTILNKCIGIMKRDTINEIIYRNTYQQQPFSFWEYIRANRDLLFAVFMTLLVLILGILFFIINRQRRRAKFELKRYHAIGNLTQEYFYEYLAHKDYLTVSDNCAHYFGISPEINRFARQLSAIPPEERRGIWQLGEYMIRNEQGEQEVHCQMQAGDSQWFSLISSMINRGGNETHAVGKIVNIQAAKSAQKKLEEQASTDGLTGIYNITATKRLVNEYLLHAKPTEQAAFLILDMDNFKQVNDKYGHQKGDAVLIQAARLIAEAFPSSIAGRLGGDEFVALSLDCSKETLQIKCQTLCENLIEQTSLLLGEAFSWSIGIALVTEGLSYDELYRRADEALYQRKQSGKNGHVFYSEAINNQNGSIR